MVKDGRTATIKDIFTPGREVSASADDRYRRASKKSKADMGGNDKAACREEKDSSGEDKAAGGEDKTVKAASEREKTTSRQDKGVSGEDRSASFSRSVFLKKESTDIELIALSIEVEDLITQVITPKR